MEFEKFDEIREAFCTTYPGVTQGKMMSSPAIHFNQKVFAFFSRKNKMVFKLGKDFIAPPGIELTEFNPFKNKKPLTGWYELGFNQQEHWNVMTETALHMAQKNF